MPIGAHVRAALKVSALLGVVALSVPVYLAAYPFGRRARRLTSYPFFRCCVLMSSVQVQRDGCQIGGNGTLYVANHVSYLDIPVLAVLADGMFVAKSEVRSWPLIGFLAQIGRTVFVSRRAAKVSSERLRIAALLAGGESIFLFPEGSSSVGAGVLPFRPGLMSAAHLDPGLTINVQPVSIAYGPATQTGQGLTATERDAFAWYGDMELAPHLWSLFARRHGTEVRVTFHPARPATEFSDTRALTTWAEGAVTAGLKRALAETSCDARVAVTRPVQPVPATS